MRAGRQRGATVTTLLVLILVLALALVAYWWWRPQSAPAFVKPYLQTLPAATPSSRILYRWQDAQGRWQVSDTPPAQGEYETLTIPLDTNVVPAIAPKDE